MKIKIYPKSMVYPCDDDSFTPDDIRRGVHWLYADVECANCGMIQTVSAMGGLDGKCVSCGHLPCCGAKDYS